MATPDATVDHDVASAIQLARIATAAHAADAAAAFTALIGAAMLLASLHPEHAGLLVAGRAAFDRALAIDRARTTALAAGGPA